VERDEDHQGQGMSVSLMVQEDKDYVAKGKVAEIRRKNDFSVNIVIDKGKEKVVLPMPFTSHSDFDILPLVDALQNQLVTYSVSRVKGQYFGATLNIFSGPQEGMRYFQQKAIID
jgi:hypothetical protein